MGLQDTKTFRRQTLVALACYVAWKKGEEKREDWSKAPSVVKEWSRGEEPLGPKIFVEMDFWRFRNESNADKRERGGDTRLMIVKHPLMGLRVEMAQ